MIFSQQSNLWAKYKNQITPEETKKKKEIYNKK